MSFFSTAFTPKKKQSMATSILAGGTTNQSMSTGALGVISGTTNQTGMSQAQIDAMRNNPSIGTVQPSAPETLETRLGVKPIDVGGSALPGDPGYKPDPLNEQPFQAIQSNPSVISGLAGFSKDQVDDTPIFADIKGPTMGSISFDAGSSVFADRKGPTMGSINLGVGSSVAGPLVNTPPPDSDLSQGTTRPPPDSDLSQGTTRPISRTDITDDQPIDFTKTATNPGYSSALDELSGAIKGKGFSGTNALIDSSRQALLAANKQAEAKSGALAQSTGNIGQGVSNSMAQQTRQSALQNLAGQESKFIELRSADQKAAIDQIVQAEQAEKGSAISAEGVSLQRSGQNLTLEQMNRQFSQFDSSLKEQIASRMQSGQQFNFNRLDEIDRFQKTMALTEKQWNAEFGSTEGQKYMNNLLELSIDNPVLAQKLQTYLLTGQEGAVGAFTPTEKAEIQRLKAEAEKREGNLENIYAKALNLSLTQMNSENIKATDTLAGLESENQRINNFINNPVADSVKGMQPSDWKKIIESPDLMAKLEGKVKDFNTDLDEDWKSKIKSMPTNLSKEQRLQYIKDNNLDRYEGQIFMQKDGTPTQIRKFDETFYGTIQCVNLLTGKNQNIVA